MDDTEISGLQTTRSKSDIHNDSIEPKCRICISNSSKEQVISPCHCRGSIGSVHRTCLERWLEAQNITNCELCKTPFTVVRTPKSIRQWFFSTRSSSERKYLLKDFVIFTLLTPMAVLSSILCINEIIFYINTRISLVSAIGISFLTVVLIFAYAFYILATLRYHYKSYVRWRQTSWNIHVLDQSPLQDSLQTEYNSQMHNQTEDQSLSEKRENSEIQMEIAQESEDAAMKQHELSQTTSLHEEDCHTDLGYVKISIA